MPHNSPPNRGGFRIRGKEYQELPLGMTVAKMKDSKRKLIIEHWMRSALHIYSSDLLSIIDLSSLMLIQKIINAAWPSPRNIPVPPNNTFHAPGGRMGPSAFEESTIYIASAAQASVTKCS
eukprot:993263_1